MGVVLEKIPLVGKVWISSGITQFDPQDFYSVKTSIAKSQYQDQHILIKKISSLKRSVFVLISTKTPCKLSYYGINVSINKIFETELQNFFLNISTFRLLTPCER